VVGERVCSVIVSAFRFLALVFALALIQPTVTLAQPTNIRFTARVGIQNSIDTADVFGEGAGADLTGQIIAGLLTIDPAHLTQVCPAGGACYGDFGAGAISVSFTLNGITSTTVSTGTMGYFGGLSGGSVLICDTNDAGNNYFGVGATSADGMVQQSLGALFSIATVFDAYGNGDPIAAIHSLGVFGNGSSLVKGGITYMNPIEHLDATILTIDVAEPAALPVFGMALLALVRARRTRTA
jgi:hypothetical protein